MWIFYYQDLTGRTRLVCVRGSYPTILSPIWRNPNTSVLMVPGFEDRAESENEQ